jgi:hypothetical protein
VSFGPNDKLCLDGQRLIQTDANGNALLPLATQTADATGLSGAAPPREFRTEIDSYSRIRAYGIGGPGTNVNDGPSYFKVWTKDGHILEYGTSPAGGTPSNAQILAQGNTSVAAWALSRRSDIKGNFIDYKYEVRDVSWGATLVTGAVPGREWNLAEIQYTGHGAQAPTNKIVFEYADKADYAITSGKLQDRSEAYQQGSRSVNVRQLQSIATYVNSANPLVLGPSATAILAKRYKLTYDNGQITNRSRLTRIAECAGTNGTICMPQTVFTYDDGGNEAYVANANFATSGLATASLIGKLDSDPYSYKVGALVILADFDGDGRTDILNQVDGNLYLSNGDGTFRQAPPLGIPSSQMLPGGFYQSLQLGNYYTGGQTCNIMFVTDFNGDGLPDIFWTSNRTDSGSLVGAACPVAPTVIYFNNGDGTFRSVIVNAPGAALQRIDPQIFNISSCNAGDQITLFNPAYNFYAFDVDGDGYTDFVTTHIDNVLTSNTLNRNTHVYLGDGAGNFKEVPTNYAAKSVFSPLTPWSPGPLSDVNGDGLLDILPGASWFYADGVGCTSISNPQYELDYAAGPFGAIVSTGDGNFLTSIGTHTLMSKPPPILNPPPGPPYVYPGGLCQQNMPGNTAFTGSVTVPVDFNGDGVVDCLGDFGVLAYQQFPHVLVDLDTGKMASPAGRTPFPGQVVERQYLSVGDGNSNLVELSNFPYIRLTSWKADSASGNIAPSGGVIAADINGDGRQDLLRWDENTTLNDVFLSRGDGTFQQSATFNLKSDALMGFTLGLGGLRNDSVPTSLLLVGNFTGRNPAEFLRLKNGANTLYVKSNPTPPDLLVSVTSPAGVLTTITYMPLANPLPGRYQPDATVAGTATYPKYVTTPPWYVVASSTVDTGVGTGTLTTKYSYRGLRGNQRGRGILGFSEVRRETYAPNGEVLTGATRRLQDYPYIGDASREELFRGTIDQTAAAVLRRTVNVYCDQTSATLASSATETTPCLPGTGIHRPYTSASTSTSWDLGGSALPTVVTARTVNACGSDMNTTVTTSGTAFGTLAQSATAATTNEYFPDNTSGDNWLICKASTSTAHPIVPNSIDNITTGAGGAPLATAIQGVAPQVSLSTPTFPTTLIGQFATGIATLSDTSTVAAWVLPPPVGPLGTDFRVDSTTCGATLAAGSSCSVTVAFAPIAGGSRTGTLSISTEAGTLSANLAGMGQVPTPPTLVFSNCTSTTPTVYPTAATMSCTLANSGQTDATSISYSAITGATVSGPIGACVASTTCGTVTVTASTAGAVSTSGAVVNGTLTATPNSGNATSTAVSLVVLTPAALSLSCTATTPVVAPSLATLTCTLSNAGQAAVSSVTYSAFPGVTVGGPMGACAGGAICGTVSVVTGGIPKTYAGTLTATPNAGAAATYPVNLVVQDTPPALVLNCLSNSPTTTPAAATLTCTLSNTGTATATSISYSTTTTGATVTGPSGPCGGSATCGTVTLTTGTTAGTYSGTLTATPSTGTGASTNVNLRVMSQAQLSFGTCTPTTSCSPATASLTCQLNNIGETQANSISYSTPAGTTVSGPTGACLGNTTCGTVVVTSGTAAGTYSGNLIATPNAGGAATTPVSLTVNTPGMFSRFYGTYNSSSAYVVMQNTGGCSITDIFGQCTATNASITSGLVSSLAPGASMTVYASVNQSSGYHCYFQFTGTGASNSPYIDTLF